MSLKNMTEEEKKARKRKQKNEAQKRYYQKNKIYYKNYSKQWSKENLLKKDKEIERLNKILEDIDTYIHLWKLEEIGEKTMLILNDILLIKNGMSDKVVRLKDVNKE